VAFNNHKGSTKSYDYVREHNEAVNRLDFITGQAPMTAEYEPGTSVEIQQPNGTTLRLAKIAADYDPSDKVAALAYIQEKERAGEVATGLLYLDAQPRDLHGNLRTVQAPLNSLDEQALCPGSGTLDKINAALR
jgi:2-oxoglutarate ferredoxin oxidoreductase subunit beta